MTDGLLIDTLFESLRLQGFAIGVDEHLRVAAILESCGGDLDFKQLKSVFLCTLAKTPQQRADLLAAIEAWCAAVERRLGQEYPDVVEPTQKDATIAHDVDRVTLITPGPWTVRWNSLWNDRGGKFGVGVAVLVIGIVISLVLTESEKDETSIELPATRESITETHPVIPETVPETAVQPTTRPSTRRAESDIPRYLLPGDPGRASKANIDVSLLIVAAIPLVAALFLYWRSRTHGVTDLDRPLQSPHGPLLPPRVTASHQPAPLTSREERQGIVWNVEQLLGEDTTDRLDLARTVESTAKNAGIVEFKMEREKFPRQIWLLRDSACRDADLFSLSAEISSSLERCALPFRTGAFFGCPSIIRFDDVHGEVEDVIAMEGRRSFVTVALLTDGRGLATALQGRQQREAQSALSAWAKWPRCVVADFGEESGAPRSGARSGVGAAPLVEPFGIECVAPAELASWLGGRGISMPAETSEEDDQFRFGPRLMWGAAVAVLGRPFDRNSALELTESLHIEVSPWDFREIAARSRKLGERFALDESDRRAWLRRAMAFDGECPPDVQDTFLQRAALFWRQSLAKLRDAEIEHLDAEARLQRRTEYDLDIAVLDLWFDPQAAADSLMTIAESGYSDEVRRCLSNLLPRNVAASLPVEVNSLAESTSIALPWAWISDDADRSFPDSATKEKLVRLGFAADHFKMRRTFRASVGIAAAVAFLAMFGIGLAAIAFHPKSIETADRSISIDMAPIPAGEFMMGSPEEERGRDSDERQHKVRLTGFLIGKTEVTRGTYRDVLGFEPDVWNADLSSRTDDPLPANSVSWFDAVRFCNALSKRDGFSEAYRIGDQSKEPPVELIPNATGYRLPTEAQWEYACRAGTTTRYSSGDSEADLDRVGWYEKNSRGVTMVGQKPANPWGLSDMHGNVWEWCHDWKGDYPTEEVIDPTGPAVGSGRVVRGGSCFSDASRCRSAFRGGDVPWGSSGFVGFRVALPLQLR